MDKSLSMGSLVQKIYECFDQIKDPKPEERKRSIRLVDCMMSALAMFQLKYPSLLQFDEARKNEVKAHNLRMLFHIQEVPSDTYFREKLDEVNPDGIRKVFKKLFAMVQRNNELKAFEFLEGHYLLSGDGTGCFSSKEIHCANCCVKKHSNGSRTYYHQMYMGALVHPDCKIVIPFPPEPIQQQDGKTKNDCERNASKRFFRDLRREHPHLKIIVVEDGLASNVPHLQTLQDLRLRYIIGVKEDDHRYLWEEFRALAKERLELKRGQTLHRFRWMNQLPLNEAHPDFLVNVLDYEETDAKGNQLHFSWVTDIPLTEQNVFQIMKGGRARWKIENETFNTLKNQGYQFEHNFGHGYHFLHTVLASIMVLAFFVDQIQELCDWFPRARQRVSSRRSLWESLRGMFIHYFIQNWDDFLTALSDGHLHAVLTPVPLDSS